MARDSNFGEFDITRELSDYEIDNFDNFMKVSNHDFSASEINLNSALEEIISDMKEELALVV